MRSEGPEKRPGSLMRNVFYTRFVIVACVLVWGLSYGRPLRADQIVLITDENGRRVYINTGEIRAEGGMTPRAVRRANTRNASPPSEEINQLVEETANRFQIDPRLVHAIISVESQYHPNAVSPKGAMGLMQLIPETAQRFGVENPFDPKENIQGGVSYLRSLLNLYGGDLSLSLAAYNAGEHAVQRFGGIPSFAETRDYVQKVTDIYQAGSPLSAPIAQGKKQQPSPVIRYVDEQGVVHYTNVE